jgi:nitrate reductase delta subunit
MIRTFKALSALLSYPGPELKAAASELRAAIASETMVRGEPLRRLGRLIEALATDDLYELQERYVDLFDRSRALSLHLFEHVHGESRDRGQAMIDLQNLYEDGGLAIGGGELPDYLPLFLEFLSTQQPAKARELLGQASHIIAALESRLEKRGSPYAAVFTALTRIAPQAGATIADDTAGDVDPADLTELDAVWEDEPVTFGPESAPGCKDDLIARLRAAKRSARTAAGGLPNV